MNKTPGAVAEHSANRLRELGYPLPDDPLWPGETKLSAPGLAAYILVVNLYRKLDLEMP